MLTLTLVFFLEAAGWEDVSLEEASFLVGEEMSSSSGSAFRFGEAGTMGFWRREGGRESSESSSSLVDLFERAFFFLGAGGFLSALEGRLEVDGAGDGSILEPVEVRLEDEEGGG